MQTSPTADTSRLSGPSFRFCIAPGLIDRSCLYYQLALAVAPARGEEQNTSMRIAHLSDRVLSQPVELRKSRLGVWTIKASDRLDVAYAMGWLHARDRAFQMDMGRRVAAGRLAELFGPGALPRDSRQRRLGLSRTAAAGPERLPANQRELLRRYVLGVNAGLAAKPASSLWHALLGRRRMEPWQESDTLLVFLALYQTLAFDLSGKVTERDLRAALPDAVASFLMPPAAPVGDGVPPVPPPVRDWLRTHGAHTFDIDRAMPRLARSSAGSNCWTLSGERTASGRAMLACDTHLAPGLPGPWHRVEAHVGARRISGASIPGLPIVIIGANGSLAWGLTNVPGDTLDVLSPDEAGPVVETADETIHVRGRRAETVQYIATAEGPLLPAEDGNEPLVVRWSGLWPASMDLGLADLAWCDTLEEGVEAARASGGPPVYLHLAHVTQGTAMTIAGRIPRRLDGVLTRDLYEPASEKPVERDSSMSQSLVSANDYKTAASPLHDKGWNHPPDHRARRIEEILRSRGAWTEQDFLTVQLDVRASHLDYYRRLAVEALEDDTAPPWPGDLRRLAAKAIDAWDGRLSAASVGAPLLREFSHRLADAVLSPFITACRQQRPGFSYAWRNTEPLVRSVLACRDPVLLGWPGELEWSGCLNRVLAEAASTLARRHDRPIDVLTWGDTRRRTMSHPVAEMFFRGLAGRLPIPGDGDEDCVNAMGDGAIPAQRLVVTPGGEERGLFAMIGGQSESLLSRHYFDHHRIWADGGATALVVTQA